MKALDFLAGIALLSTPAVAAQRDEIPATLAVRVKAGTPLGQALRDIALQARLNLVAPADLLRGRGAPEVNGEMSAQAAINALLAGSGLASERVGDAIIVTQAAAAFPRPGAGDIVVTGTRIRGAGPVGSNVITVDRQDIDRGGFATAQQIVQALPQNFGGGPNEVTFGLSNRDNAGLNVALGAGVNLRGLGPTSTLVLLDGNRPPLGGFSGIFADLSLVPASVIERVEILADGASAIYGSDAVAGVVNIIPRKGFDGAESGFRIGTADGAREEVQASQLFGTRWQGGSALIAYEIYRADRLAAAGRRFASEDLRPFGGPDSRQPYANPGTIFAQGRFFAIPVGQDGVGLTADRLRPDERNAADQWRDADLLPAQRRHALFATVEQEVGAVTLYAQALWADRRSERRNLPSTSNAPRTVTSANPFYVDPIGTGEPIDVFYGFNDDLGPETDTARVRAFGGATGARVDLGAWSAEGRITYGRQTERSRTDNIVNFARLNRALADPDPTTAYNLFGQGPVTNPATIAAVRGFTSANGRYALWSATAKADGPIFELPGGAARLAVGGEYREERFQLLPSLVDITGLEPRPLAIEGLPPSRRIQAGFGELLLPLAGPDQRLPFVRRLVVSLAARAEHYSDFGSTTNPKVGLQWEPVDGVGVRATWGTSFRAPIFNDLRQGPDARLIFAVPLPDPTAPGGTTNALVLRGNKPDLGPERARTWTAGVDLRPTFAPGLRVSLTWFDVRYRDRIASPASELFSFLTEAARFEPIIDRAPTMAEVARLYADAGFRNFFNVPADSIAAIIDARTQNLAEVRQTGLDFVGSYAFAALGGRATIGVDGTWLSRFAQAVTRTAPLVDVVDTLGAPADLRLRGSASWSGRFFDLAAFINHTGSYRNQTVTPVERVSAWTTVDLTLAYTARARSGPFAGLRFALNVSNLFDRDPPYVLNSNGLSFFGFNPDLSNPLGRVVSLQVTKTW